MMAELLAPFNPGWVHPKDALCVSNPLAELLKFYAWGTPCEGVSSSGVTMRKRGWPKDVWKSAQLRTYLLSVANLRDGGTYKKAKTIESMTDAATEVGLGSGTFHSLRDCNRVVFYSDGSRPDILSIFYYIRCAFAHGRFEIYHKEGSPPVYVLEAVQKKRGTTECSVRARIIVLEETLLTWKDVLTEGPSKLKTRMYQLSDTIQHAIIKTLSGKSLQKKKGLVDALPYDHNLVYSELRKLKEKGIVEYSQRQWKLVGGDPA